MEARRRDTSSAPIGVGSICGDGHRERSNVRCSPDLCAGRVRVGPLSGDAVASRSASALPGVAGSTGTRNTRELARDRTILAAAAVEGDLRGE